MVLPETVFAIHAGQCVPMDFTENAMQKSYSLLLVGAFAALMIAGCSDPTSGMRKAETTDAKNVEAVEGKELTFSNDNSKISFVGSKVTGKHDGGFNKFSGKVTVDPDGKTVKRVEVEIDMKSVWTDDDESDEPKLSGHLMSKDFFDAENHPTAKFVSTEIKKGEGDQYSVVGNLTMRGTTKSVTFPATITAADGRVSTKAEFSINRQDWKVSFPGMTNDMIRDDVGLTLDINAA